MELKIFWTDFSLNELENIYSYYKDAAGINIAKKIVLNIIDRVTILKKYPKIGQIEDLLLDREQEYRYLVVKNYKIIYWINEDKNWIEIIDIFDTRQYPGKMTNR
jgi:plasmid stabilization system protein ParE